MVMNNIKFAPIALFTYNRADHTQSAVESLLMNAEAKDSDLFIFSDGAKNEKAIKGVNENREYIHSISGFKSITIIEREKNCGLANSLIAGITDVINRYGRVIVVEDDLILSPYFLKFMNDVLDKYKDDERVASISGFLNPVGEVNKPFFLRYFACWGWATWKRGWDLLINDSRELLRKLRWKTNDFNIGGTGPFYGILYCDKVGLNDSWAVRFYASQFLAGKLQLFPNKTLVVQGGTDGSGTHCTERDTTYDGMQVAISPIKLYEIPVKESKIMYKVYSRFYGKRTKVSIRYYYNKLKSFVRRLLGVDYR